MNYYLVYIIFAAATASSALYEIYWPLLKEARALGIVNELTASPKLSSFVFWCIQFIFAPVVIVVVFIPGLSAAATTGLRKVIESEN